MTKSLKISLITAVVLLIAVIIAYFAVVLPMTATDDTADVPLETEEGEDISGSRYYIFPKLDRDSISVIDVSNEAGGYTFYKASDGNFYIDGLENLKYDEYAFASLVNVAGNTLAKDKIWTGTSDEKLAEYGLDSPRAYWTVTGSDGGKYRVYIGDKLLTGGGYYCMYEGRRSVYVLDVTIEDTVLAPVEKMLSPVLFDMVSKDDYYTTDNFTVYNGNEVLLKIGIADKSEQINPDAKVENKFLYPEGYVPDTELYYNILYSFMGLSGTSVYKAGADEDDYAACGLTEPAFSMVFDYKGSQYIMAVSAKNEDGTYYAVTSQYPNLIAVVDAKTMYYSEYKLLDWIEPSVYQYYITTARSLKLTTADTDVTFSLAHSADKEGNATLEVSASNGLRITEDDAVSSFRQFYKGLVAITIEDYTELTDEQIASLTSDASKCILSFTYTNLTGEDVTYAFYPYTTRKSLMTINGEGEFYVQTDAVQKVINDLARVLAGETVTAFEKK